MTITVNLRALKAINQASSTEATRYYLKGVCVTATSERIEYVATDEYMLLATSHENEGGNEGVWIIPSSIIASIKIAKRDDGLAKLICLYEGGHKLALEFTNGQSITFDAIDGTFPDWRRIVSPTFTGEHSNIATTFLTRAEKAGVALGIRNPHQISILHNGNGPALLRFNSSDDEAQDNLFGVVMPYRGESYLNVPGWVRPNYDDPCKMREAAE